MSPNMLHLLTLTPLALAAVLPRQVAQEQQRAVLRVQTDVTSLAAYLTNNSNVADAQNAYNIASTDFASLAKDILTYDDCSSSPRDPQDRTLDEAISFLNDTQSYLEGVLEEINGPQDLIADAFCNANASFASVEYYAFNVLGNSTAPQTSTTFETAEVYAQLSLQALQSALGIINGGDPASEYSRIALDGAQDAIHTFERLGGLAGSYSCPADTLTPSNDSFSAYDYTVGLKTMLIPNFYDNTVAAGTADVATACNISDSVGAISAYVNKGYAKL